MNFLRKSGTSIEIGSDDSDYECNVLFLWTKKNKTVIDTVKRHTSELMDMGPSLGWDETLRELKFNIKYYFPWDLSVHILSL